MRIQRSLVGWRTRARARAFATAWNDPNKSFSTIELNATPAGSGVGRVRDEREVEIAGISRTYNKRRHFLNYSLKTDHRLRETS